MSGKNMNLYFKVLKGAQLFDSFMNLANKRIEYNSVIQKFVKKYNSDPTAENVIVGNNGGVIGVEFKSNPPKNWIKAYRGAGYENYYRPNAKLKAISKEMAELPKVTREQWNSLIAFEPTTAFDGDNLRFYNGFAIFFKDEYILLSVPSVCEFNREGLIEITGTEFLELQNQ